VKDATDHESKMKAALEKAKADAAAGKSNTLNHKPHTPNPKPQTRNPKPSSGKSGGGLFGKKPVPMEELEASHVAAASALKDKSDLYRKDMPNILEGLEQIERARLNTVHRCMQPLIVQP